MSCLSSNDSSFPETTFDSTFPCHSYISKCKSLFFHHISFKKILKYAVVSTFEDRVSNRAAQSPPSVCIIAGDRERGLQKCAIIQQLITFMPGDILNAPTAIQIMYTQHMQSAPTANPLTHMETVPR